MKGLLAVALVALATGAVGDDRRPTLDPFDFPPKGAGRRVRGELLEADFIRRAGLFRAAETGDLVDFMLVPSAPVMCRGAEGDLRDLPLGSLCEFSLYPDDRGEHTRVALIRDEFSRLAEQGVVYRLDGPVGGGMLEATVIQGGTASGEHLKLRLDANVGVWRSGAPSTLAALAAGDEMLVNLGGTSSGRCTEVWADAASRKLATEDQGKRHDAFLRVRGLAARIDRVEPKRLTVSLIGDPASLRGLCRREGIDPARWASDRRQVHAVVANDELRTYNPHVDGQRSTVVACEATPTDAIGVGGIRWVIEPPLMLEGFRPGRIVRLFVHPSWPIADMPFGETLYSEVPNVQPSIEEPLHYPYRTDFANEHLPWYRLQPGQFPPLNSHHRVAGELLAVGIDGRSGRFRADKNGVIVDFSMPPYGTIVYADAEAELRDVPIGTRCRFSLHPDEHGEFTRASAIVDEATDDALGEFSYRVDRVAPDEGKLFASRRHARVRDDKEELIQPPDVGRSEFVVDASTRVWKGETRVGLDTLAPGDDLLIDRSGRTRTNPGVCVDIWIGAEARRHAAETRQARHDDLLLAAGIPGWVESVEGKTVVVSFFAARRKALRSLLDKHEGGDRVVVEPVDEALRPADGPPATSRLKDQRWDGFHAPTIGSGGVHWTIEGDRPDDRLRPGRAVRIRREGWAAAGPNR